MIRRFLQDNCRAWGEVVVMRNNNKEASVYSYTNNVVGIYAFFMLLYILYVYI